MITGYFRRRGKARAAIDSLRDAGFTRAQVSLALRPDDELEPAVPPAAIPQSFAAKTTKMWTKVVGYFDQRGGERGSSYEEFQGTLSGFTLPEAHARYFGYQFNQGDEGAIVSVVAPGREEGATEILQSHGGDIGKDAVLFEYPSASAIASSSKDAP